MKSYIIVKERNNVKEVVGNVTFTEEVQARSFFKMACDTYVEHGYKVGLHEFEV